jgi:hypothetical protein
LRIASEVSGTPGWQPVSASTVYRTLTELGYGNYKRIVKPGLIEDIKQERLDWCLDYEDWTLEQWKNIIFSDETSVQLASVRGKRRIWRKPDKVYHHYCTIIRWKGFQEFI